MVGSGPNGANPHHEAGDRTIEVGDAVVLDFGGLMDGYGSDTSRTVCVGEPSAEVREVHEVVRLAQQAGVEAVRPGVACQEIDRAARAVITDAGYGEQFIHRTGHGIGITTHEPPYMVEGEEQPLVPGMCFSVEPGIYLAGRFGVRIEDIVTVTETGGRRLNNTGRDLRDRRVDGALDGRATSPLSGEVSGLAAVPHSVPGSTSAPGGGTHRRGAHLRGTP